MLIITRLLVPVLAAAAVAVVAAVAMVALDVKELMVLVLHHH